MASQLGTFQNTEQVDSLVFDWYSVTNENSPKSAHSVNISSDERTLISAAIVTALVW